ncbi:conserved hypothetical protein [Neospora caninum Liverpool]|uniref:Uncharacterized protein n=1 Tax=Neospora caninum (strain Liverpool) TaxID=572307 RepID=F0VE10_NEOCL|nr:conserved hypothetical protein [Neospora caninum Liverpool]CBZ51953.1 conserved hypothetical protein [Neospora caninum Liverpool]CEL65914.1 TPA: hypothetical protein BN1204_017450 [Neospora caninum Liverpool]|eukprot:XP_003881986.1 conserved hypothetical protein [Neospora caninum Liverpool]
MPRRNEPFSEHPQTRTAPSLLATSEVYGQLEKALGELHPTLEASKASSHFLSSRVESSLYSTCLSSSSARRNVSQHLGTELAPKKEGPKHHAADFHTLSADKAPLSSQETGNLYVHRSQHEVFSALPRSTGRLPLETSRSVDLYGASPLQGRRDTRKSEALGAAETPSRIPIPPQRSASRGAFAPSDCAEPLRPRSGVSDAVSSETARRKENTEEPAICTSRGLDRQVEWRSPFSADREFDAQVSWGISRESQPAFPRREREPLEGGARREVKQSSSRKLQTPPLADTRAFVTSLGSSSVADVSADAAPSSSLIVSGGRLCGENGDARTHASRLEPERQTELTRSWTSRERAFGSLVSSRSVNTVPAEAEPAGERHKVGRCREPSRGKRSADSTRHSAVSAAMDSVSRPLSSRFPASVAAASPASRLSTAKDGREHSGDPDRTASGARAASLSGTSRTREERGAGDKDSTGNAFPGAASVRERTGPEQPLGGEAVSAPAGALGSSACLGSSRLPPLPASSRRALASSLSVERRRSQPSGLMAELRRLADDVHALRDEYLDQESASLQSAREATAESERTRGSERARLECLSARGVPDASLERRHARGGREASRVGEGAEMRQFPLGEARPLRGVSSAFASEDTAGKRGRQGEGEVEKQGRWVARDAARRVSRSLSPGQFSSGTHSALSSRHGVLPEHPVHASPLSRVPSSPPSSFGSPLPSSLLASSLSSRGRAGSVRETSGPENVFATRGGLATTREQAEQASAPPQSRDSGDGVFPKKRPGEERAFLNQKTPPSYGVCTAGEAKRSAPLPDDARRGGTERSQRDSGGNGVEGGGRRATEEREVDTSPPLYSGEKTNKGMYDDVLSSSLYVHRTRDNGEAQVRVLRASVGSTMQASVEQDNQVGFVSRARSERSEEAEWLLKMKEAGKTRQECGDGEHAIGLSPRQTHASEVERHVETRKNGSPDFSPVASSGSPRLSARGDEPRRAAGSGVRTGMGRISGAEAEARKASFAQKGIAHEAQGREENGAVDASRGNKYAQEKQLEAFSQSSSLVCVSDDEQAAENGEVPGKLESTSACPRKSSFPVVGAQGNSSPRSSRALSDPFEANVGSRSCGASVSSLAPHPFSSSALFPASPSLRLRYLGAREERETSATSPSFRPDSGADAAGAKPGPPCQEPLSQSSGDSEFFSLFSCLEGDREPRSREAVPAPSLGNEGSTEARAKGEAEAGASADAPGLVGACSRFLSSLCSWAGNGEEKSPGCLDPSPARDADPSAHSPSCPAAARPPLQARLPPPAAATEQISAGEGDRSASPSSAGGGRQTVELQSRRRARVAKLVSDWRAFLRLVRRRQLSKEGVKPASAFEALLTLAALSLPLPHEPSTPFARDSQSPHWLASPPGARGGGKGACSCACELCSEEWSRARLFSGAAPVFSANDEDLRLCKKDIVLLFLLRSFFRDRLVLSLEKSDSERAPADLTRGLAQISGRPVAWRLVCASVAGSERGPSLPGRPETRDLQCGRARRDNGNAGVRETAESLRRRCEPGNTDGHDGLDAEVRRGKLAAGEGFEAHTPLCAPRECGLVAWAVATLQTPGIRASGLHVASSQCTPPPEDCNGCVHVDFSPLVRRLADELGCLDTAAVHASDVARVVFSCSLMGAKRVGASFQSEKSVVCKPVSSLLSDSDCRRMFPVAASLADWLTGCVPSPRCRGCLDTPDAFFALLLATTARLTGSDASARSLSLCNSVLLQISSSLLRRCASPIGSLAAWLLAAGRARLACRSHLALFALPLLLAAGEGTAEGHAAPASRCLLAPQKTPACEELDKTFSSPDSRLSSEERTADRSCGDAEEQFRKELEEVEEEEGEMLAEAQECWAMLQECCSEENGEDDPHARTLRRRLEWNCLRLEGRATALAARRVELERALRGKPGTGERDGVETRDVRIERVDGGDKAEAERNKTATKRTEIDEVKAAQLVDLLWGLTVCGVPARPIFGEIVRQGILSRAASLLPLDDLCCVACAFAVQANRSHSRLASPDSDNEANADPGLSPSTAKAPERNVPRGPLVSQVTSPVASRFSGDENGDQCFEAASPVDATAPDPLSTDPNADEFCGGNTKKERRPPPSWFFERNLATRLQFYVGLGAPYTRKIELREGQYGGDLRLALRSRRGSHDMTCEEGVSMARGAARSGVHEERVSASSLLRDSWLGRAWVAATAESKREFDEVAKSAVKEIAAVVFSRQTRQGGDLEGRRDDERYGAKMDSGASACMKYALRCVGAAEVWPWRRSLSERASSESAGCGICVTKRNHRAEHRDVFSICGVQANAPCPSDTKARRRSGHPPEPPSCGWESARETVLPSTKECFPAAMSVSQRKRDVRRRQEDTGFRANRDASSGAPVREDFGPLRRRGRREVLSEGERSAVGVSPLQLQRPERTRVIGAQRDGRVEEHRGRFEEREETAREPPSQRDRPLRLDDLAGPSVSQPHDSGGLVQSCGGNGNSLSVATFESGQERDDVVHRQAGRCMHMRDRQEESTHMGEEDHFFSFFGENDARVPKITKERPREKDFGTSWPRAPETRCDSLRRDDDAAVREDRDSQWPYVCDGQFSEDEEGFLKPLFRFFLSVAVRGGTYAAYLLMGYALIILATTGLWVSSSASGRHESGSSGLELAGREAFDAKLSFRATGSGRGDDQYGEF